MDAALLTKRYGYASLIWLLLFVVYSVSSTIHSVLLKPPCDDDIEKDLLLLKISKLSKQFHMFCCHVKVIFRINVFSKILILKTKFKNFLIIIKVF